MKDGLVIDMSKGSIEEVELLSKLWQQFKPDILVGERKYTKEDMARFAKWLEYNCMDISFGGRPFLNKDASEVVQKFIDETKI